MKIAAWNVFTTNCLSLGFVYSARLCKSSATIIGNVVINCVANNKLKKSIIKSDISDYLPVIFAIQRKRQSLAKNKKIFNEANEAAFNQQLFIHNLWHVNSQKGVKKMYETFLSTFLETIYFKTNNQ